MSASNELDRWLNELPEPVKNRFFYGMLLNEHTMFRDQNFFEAKRWLLNRLTLGTGVLTGLDTEFCPAGKPPTGYTPASGDAGPWIMIGSGVAIDGFGREIVVPSTLPLARRVFPVCIGNVEHEIRPADPGVFVSKAMTLLKLGILPHTFYLRAEICRRDFPTDLIPVRAGVCPQRFEPSAVSEGFGLRFYAMENAPVVNTNTDEGVSDIFPNTPSARAYRALAQDQGFLRSPFVPSKGARPAWVPLGVLRCTVTAPKKIVTLDFADWIPCSRQVFSNDALSRLIFGLAERVDEVLRVPTLIYDTTPKSGCGEGQSGAPGAALKHPLHVKVIDRLGNAVPNVKVEFELLTHHGASVSPSPLTGADGATYTHWTLGNSEGLHTVAARIAPAKAGALYPGAHLVFHALAK